VSTQSKEDPGTWKILAPTGRIDSITGSALEASCHEAIESNPQVALDLRGVAYMSSAGLRVLLSSLKFASSRNAIFLLIGPQEAVREVLEMSGFSRIFGIVDVPSRLP
jgi:anti-sigma B factor antagonist